jgi:adenylate kinase
MRLVLVGPPGSGKGTQAERLVKHFELTPVGTGAMFRDAMARGTEMGREVTPLMKQGLLVPDTIVNDVVAELFRGPDRPDCFVMDGYPRTYAQAIAFDALLKLELLPLDAVINLTISDDDVVRRIGGRMCCATPTCGLCFNKYNLPPKATGVCDKCDGPLVIREDDKDETIRRRLGEFHKNTDALLDHYRRQDLVDDISATDAPDVIFQNILTALHARSPVTAEGRKR